MSNGRIAARAGRGSVGGASDDAGVEYRRGVAAYAVACGLSGNHLVGFGIPEADANVQSVALETEDALDDIRVEFESGRVAYIQAKRTLRRGTSLTKAVAQWVKAAQASSSDSANDTLVIVSGQLSGPMQNLQRVLERQRTGQPGPPTEEEADIFEHLLELLSVLTEKQREFVLRRAVICELAVEELHDRDNRLAIAFMRQVVSTGQTDDAVRAWKELIFIAGRTARLRAGHELPGWLEGLRGQGIQVATSGTTPAADLERLHTALQRYQRRLIQEGNWIDLRGLGAELAPIPVIEADATVKVAHDSADPRGKKDLIWAFLRRGRVILTGLPGGGKSTAIRRLAAQLCEIPGTPLPIRVSLKEVDALGQDSGFRDRLLSTAVRDDLPEDRALIRRELDRRLTDGGVALLLDGLDETYDRRRTVISQIDDLMNVVSKDVDALVSTRDVAYGHAATLGWDDLVLRPPSEATRTVKAVLRKAIDKRPIPAEGQRPRKWVDERMRWVKNALAEDPTLQETPLLPVLLALLAAEKDLDTLPTSRASILLAVVTDVVARYELGKRDTPTLGSLADSAAGTAALHAFASEASAILNANGRITLAELIPIVAAEILDYWGMSRGHAETTARDMIRFFDTNGIFVIAGARETVGPRISLFAEIGDALRATSHPAKIIEWVNSRVEARQLEPLILAAGLNHLAAQALAGVAAKSQDRDLLYAAVRAYREGAVLSSKDLQAICAGLINDFGQGTFQSWESWSQVLHLPITQEMRHDIEKAASAYDHRRQKLIQATLDMRFLSREELQERPESLLELLAITDLPVLKRPPSMNVSTISLHDLLVDSQLHDAQTAAADTLIGSVREAIAVVVERGKNGPQLLAKELRRILIQRGFPAEAAEISEETGGLPMPAWLRDHETDSERRLLEVLASNSPSELTYAQRTRVDELAVLLETLRMNDASSWHMFKRPNDIPGVVDLAQTLFGFDKHVIAAQALLILQRMDTVGGPEPYYGLFDRVRSADNHNWERIIDPDSAVQLLGRMMTWGRAHAWFAASALWGAPVAASAAPMLRQLLPELVSSTTHQRIAAHTLTSLGEGPEPECWFDCDDPVLRAVSARWCALDAEGKLTPEHTRLLEDPDGYVRKAAVSRAAELHPPELESLLRDVGNQQPASWMCLSCRTTNPPDRTGCAKSKCYGASPNLSHHVQELISMMDNGTAQGSGTDGCVDI